MDPALLDDVDVWLSQYVAATDQLTAGAVAGTSQAYARIYDWYDPAQTLTAAATAAAVATTARQALTGAATQWIATLLNLLTRAPATVAAPAVPQIPDYPRAGVDPFEVYSRPVFEYRNTIARGGTTDQAQAAASARAQVIAETDSILAERDAVLAAIADQDARGTAKITGYRRIIRPELSESGTCGLCVAASTQIYRSSVLLPIHDRCKCKIAPIVGAQDPGGAINRRDIGQLYTDADGRTAAALKRTRYVIGDHDELGPILVPGRRKPRPRTPAEAAAAASSELAQLLPVLDRLEARATAGEDVAGPLDYQRLRIDQLQRLAAA